MKGTKENSVFNSYYRYSSGTVTRVCNDHMLFSGNGHIKCPFFDVDSSSIILT